MMKSYFDLRILFITSLVSIIFTPEIKACSCSDVPKSFMKNLKANHIIFMGVVLEQIVIPNDSSAWLLYHGLTKLKIDKWYQNKMESDTIYYAKGSGSMCSCSMSHLKKGNKVILKTVVESIYNPTLEFSKRVDKKLIRFMESFKNKTNRWV